MATCAQDGCARLVGVGWNRCPVHVETLLAVLPFRVLDEVERLELARRVQAKRAVKDAARLDRTP